MTPPTRFRQLSDLLAFTLLVLLLFTGLASIQAQSTRPGIDKDTLLVSMQQVSGGLDTFNLVDLIDGTDKTRVLYDQYGQPINHASLAGKVVMLDFWYLACPPCIVELPGLVHLRKKLASDDFILLTFSQDTYTRIQETLFKHRPLDIRIVEGVSLVSYRLYPLKVVYDRLGRRVDLKMGGSIGEYSIQQLLDKYYPLIRKLL